MTKQTEQTQQAKQAEIPEQFDAQPPEMGQRPEVDLEQVRLERETFLNGRLAMKGAKNPELVKRLFDLGALEESQIAEAVDALTKSDGYLFEPMFRSFEPVPIGGVLDEPNLTRMALEMKGLRHS